MVLWLNGSLWNQKWFFFGIAVKNLLKHLFFVPAWAVEKYSQNPSKTSQQPIWKTS